MKKQYIGILCGISLLLTGCGSQSALMKSYTDTTLSNKAALLSASSDEAAEFFAADLAVFPKEASNLSAQPDEAESLESKTLETEDDITFAESVEETADMYAAETTLESEDTPVEVDIDSNVAFLAGRDSLENLYGKNIYERVSPASVTKILTALLTIENCDFGDTVTFTEDMVVTDYDAKLCDYSVGDVLTVEQLFNGLLVNSGNDAANALAIHISGSLEAFGELMNSRAKSLGCVDSHFVNPSGLHDDNHYTSAYDLYLIFNECLKHEKFVNTIRQSDYATTYLDAEGKTVEAEYTTTNQYFLDNYNYPDSVRVIGGKTGTTDQAGSCLILYDTNQENDGFISIILGAYDPDTLYSEMNILLNKIPK